jgi:hypothetical protein
MVPGELKTLPSPGGVVKLFGRDSHHDADGHREDFGRFIPDWGGRDLWLLQVGAGVDGKGLERPSGYLSIEHGTRDFNTLGTKHTFSGITAVQEGGCD